MKPGEWVQSIFLVMTCLESEVLPKDRQKAFFEQFVEAYENREELWKGEEEYFRKLYAGLFAEYISVAIVKMDKKLWNKLAPGTIAEELY